MKRHLTHALRRTARRLIGWSNRLDRPQMVSHMVPGTARPQLPNVADAVARVIAAEERLRQARESARR